MKAVHKYPLEPKPLNEIEMPQGAEILKVDNQMGFPQVWALVNPKAPTEIRKIRCLATGEEYDETKKLSFLDTIQLSGGRLVFHFFEESK